MRINLRQVQAFRSVMQYGSITAAARAIGVTQPAVSRLIADLEHVVGFALFDRRGGKVVPTTEAIEFYGEVDRMYYGLERLELVASEIRHLRRARLNVATMPMVAFHILPQVLRAFVEEHGGIRLTHNVHTSARIVDLIASRQAELGVAQLHGLRQDIERLASFHTRCICVLPPDHPLAAEPVLTPRRLAGVPMVALTHHSVTSGHVARAFADAGLRPRIVVESQPSFSACALVAAGLGVAIVDPMTPEVFGAALVRRPFAPVLPFDFHILKASAQPLSRAGTAFLETLLRHLGGMAGVERLAG